MPTEVIMPKVDMDMASGRIALWHVAEGETVKKGAPLFDIETDKAAMEVESPANGTLHHVRVEAGGESPIGEAVAWIYAEGETVGEAPKIDLPEKALAAEPPSSAAGNGKAPVDAAKAEGRDEATAPAGDATSGRVRATPVARRIARQHGVALDAVRGSGPRGRIQRADVQAFLEESTPTAREPRRAVRADGAKETPRIVCLHGFAADRTIWRRLMDTLGESVAPADLELASHGRNRATVASFDALCDDAAARFEEIADGPCNLLAHSLGAAVAIRLADRFPHLVESLALVSPAGLGAEINGAVVAGLGRAGSAESLAPWLKRLVADPERISWNFVQSAMAGRSDPALREAQSRLADKLFPDGTQAFDIRATLEAVAQNIPTRILFGRADTIIPWQHALRAPSSVALHFFDGIGHLPQIEAAPAVARVLAMHWRLPDAA